MIIATWTLTSGLAYADVVVVVAAQSPIRAISNSQIADVFLGKLTRLPDGTQAVALDQAEGSATRDEFYAKVAAKSPSQLKAYWSKLIFTGKGRPPRALSSDLAVLQAVRDNRLAIGYVERRSADASVRVLP